MQVPTLLSVSVSPTSGTGGTTSTGTITVYGQGYTFIGLSSNNSAVQVPSSVAVGGASTFTFPITTSAVSSPVTATITATESFAQSPPRSPIVQTAMLTVNSPATYAVDLAVVATGSNKTTLYWAGYSGAVGYNVYRGLQSGGPYTRVNSAGPVNIPDNSVAVTNTFMYTDSPLVAGTTYYYYVAPVTQGGTESGQSNEASAIPDASAVPWDTADPTRIINAVSATAALDLEPDIDDTRGSTPAQVGVLQVAGPDGTIYMGNFPDGSPAQAFTSHGYSDGYCINYDDGRVVAAPRYDQPTGIANAFLTTGLAGQVPLAAPVLDHSPFPATDPPTGPYREVRSMPGYTGFSAAVGIPNTGSQTITLVDHISTSQPGSGAPDVGHHYTDSIDIYTGGYVYQGPGKVDTFTLDAGLQLTLSKLQNGSYVTGYWTPGITAARPKERVKHNPNSLLPSVL